MISKHTFPILAKEGWFHIILSGAVALILTVAFGLVYAWPLWLLFIFCVQFFRDPKRTIPTSDDAIVAPAHGKVVFTGPAFDPYLKRDALRVSIFMNVFSVHSNFTPYQGEVKDIWYHPGKFVNAALDKASEENERNAMHIESTHNDKKYDIVFVQVAGLVARRILCYAKKGEYLGKGHRYGYIRFGSKVDVYLPIEANITVKIGDSVMSGNDVIAKF